MEATQEKVVLIHRTEVVEWYRLVGCDKPNRQKGNVTSSATASPMTNREAKVERGQWLGHETVASRAALVGYLLTPDMVQKLLGERCADRRLLALRETWLGPPDSALYKKKGREQARTQRESTRYLHRFSWKSKLRVGQTASTMMRWSRPVTLPSLQRRMSVIPRRVLTGQVVGK